MSAALTRMGEGSAGEPYFYNNRGGESATIFLLSRLIISCLDGSNLSFVMCSLEILICLGRVVAWLL